jgi:GNAT superfamily N-acetyltransferase
MIRKPRYQAKSINAMAIRIRSARTGDVAEIAKLSGQLGYPATRAQINGRLRSIKAAGQHAVFVAELSNGRVIGWVHVSITPLLESERRAEVNALVVAEDSRSLGAGALLLQSAEKWARGRLCKSMSVRSNILRKRAHGFYLRNDYEHYKTQKAFRKEL